MKKHLHLSLFALTLLLGQANAAETDATRADLATPRNQTTQNNVVRVAPIQNHWDANAWDQTGGSLFWHDLSEKRRAALSERHQKRPQATTGTKSKANSER